MGKFNRHGKLRGKGKRWPKGQSCSSNPETTKFRDAAKRHVRFAAGLNIDPGKFGAVESGGSALTSGALQKHNEVLGEDKREKTGFRDDTTFTLGGKTFASFTTFASDWTECTNVSFSRLLSNFRSNNAVHKEQLAVLAAVTDIIKAKNGNATATEYFAALLTTLDVMENEESLATVASLLGMVIKNAPSSVLQLKFSECVKSLADLLGRYATSENCLLLKSLIRCLSVLLRAQELSVWNNPSTLQIYDGILSFALHSRPKVRKGAQHAVCAILRGSSIMLSENPPAHHPAATQTAKFFVHQINSNTNLSGTTTILHILTILKELLGVFPKALVETLCESILMLMTHGNVMITLCCLKTLHGMFVSHPHDGALPARLNSQLISALYDCQPSVVDTQITPAWLAVVQEAHKSLHRLNAALCVGHLPRLFSTCMQLWLSEKAKIITSVTKCLTTVVLECLKPSLEAEMKEAIAAFEKIIPSIEACLKYQFHLAWGQVLQVLAAMFEAANTTCYSCMVDCLRTLGQLHISENFSFLGELDYAIGKAVSFLGPRIVLSAIPLQITGNEDTYDFPYSWMLQVLRDNICNTELRFFREYFIPLATACLKKSRLCSDNGDTVGKKSYWLLYLQMWALLPPFCNSPTDFAETFKSMAKILGTAIRDRKEIRMDVLASLRHLVNNNLENAKNRTELARFAKNYLPILFNLYTTLPECDEESGQCLAVYETIKCYLQITDIDLCNSLFDKALSKLSLAESEAIVKVSVLDLLRLLVRYQDSCRVKQLYDVLVPLLISKDHKMQKKTYRLLEELLGNDAEECVQFTKQNIDNFERVLLKGLSSSAPSSKAPRLNCMLHMLRRLEAGNYPFLQEVIPEAVLCCKDGNVKVRNAAFMLLIEGGRTLQRWTEKPAEETVQDYLQLLMAGLTGSPSMVTATLLSLARILHEFKDVFPSNALQLLCKNVCMLLSSRTREVVKGAVSCIKVLFTCFPPAETAAFLPTVLKSMTDMTEDTKRHCRQKLRDIFTRLTRKFGYDVVANLIPRSDVIMQKRLKNIRKEEMKKKKQWYAAKSAVAESDSDEEVIIKGKPVNIDDILADSDSDVESKDMGTSGKKQQLRKKTRSAWIQEGGESIVDFLDPTAAQKITVTNPEAKTVQKKAGCHSFRTAPDGRLVITESAKDDDDCKGVNVADAELMEDDDFLDNLEEVSQCHGKKRKSSVLGRDNWSEAGPELKYQTGGIGIHRSISEAVQGRKKSDSQKADYGAEYRAKKARGDVKKKGKPDPYVYVPLLKKTLNRRKKAKYAGQFKGLVHAAKKGAARGMKSKQKSKKL